MQWEIEGGAYSVLVTAVNCEAVITPSAPLKVEIGECARIEVESALNYIESGSVEIATAVASGLDVFNEHATQKTAEFDEHVEDSIACAKNWAVKTDGSVDGEEYSAKYYANEAKNTLLNAADHDLSNLTPIGIAKFTAKQDTLVSGTNIKTINGTSLLGSGDIVIQSAPNLDNKSITKNTANELQTVGVINQNNASQAIKTWTGTKAQYDAIVSKDSGTLYYLTDVQKIYYGNTLVCEKYNRNIGEIITSSIPLTDAGLHLLDGSLIQGGGIYDDFVQYIAGLVNTYPQCFCSEAEWQQSVNTYGVCGKFVYSNNTVRLPKITGFIEGTIDSNALGDLVEAGLPNITGSYSWAFGTYGALYDNNASAVTGAFGVGSATPNKFANGVSGTGYILDFNASRSSSIYGNSSTVQPQSIKVFYYIVIATSTKTDIQVNIDEVITDLNGKANDTDVVHKTGNETILGEKITTAKIEMQSTNGSTSPVLSFHIPGVRHSHLIETSKGLEVQEGSGTFLDRLYAGSSDEMDTVVTTTGIFRAPSESQDNYVKLGNGLLVQWGHIQQNSQQLNVTFPIPFKNTAYRMFTQDAGQLSGYSYAGVTGVTRTTTGATLYSYYANRYYDWLAIGFWY